MEKHAELTEAIIGCAFRVQRALGPGFLETVYQRALAVELTRAGLKAELEVPLKVTYDGCIVGDYSADILVETKVVVELKAVQSLTTAHEVQVVHYLTATGIEVGLLINFGAATLQFKRKHPDRNTHYRPVTPVSAHPVPPVQNSVPPAHRRLIDITHPLANTTAPWPGDTQFAFSFVSRLRDGASCNVGKFTSGIHSGTHMDAPYHYNESGPTIDQLDLDLLIGPARVFLAQNCPIITRDVFAGLDALATPRVLVRTNHCDDKTQFPADIPTLADDVPAWLGAQGVKLIGLDLPSVDKITDPSMRIHHLLDAANILILENLDLRAAAPGCYELIALPLKIAGAEGSPIRAVLRGSPPDGPANVT